METRTKGLTNLLSEFLRLEEPWYIPSIKTQDREVHIYMNVCKGNRLACPDWGSLCYRAGYEKSEGTWRHGGVMFYPCYIHCRRPRVKCDKHKTKVVQAPWARKSSRFTLKFEDYAMLILADMPVLKASLLLHCNAMRNHLWECCAIG